MNKPNSVIVLGVEYSITYVDNPSEVDLYKRKSIWGQVDFWTRSIRIYDNGQPIEDVWHSIMHEVLHCISNALKLELGDDDNHDELDLLALALVDTFARNNWMDFKQAT